MAGGQERILRQRLKTVRATRKITKAMELIAASQIPRSQARIVANRPYRDGMRQVLVEAVKGDPAAAKKLLTEPEHVRSAVVLVITGDRGLSGSYNSSVLRAGERLVARLGEQGTSVRLFAVGKKAASFFRYRGLSVERSFVGFADRPTFASARGVAAVVAAPFADGSADQVLLVSTRFLSAGSQLVQVDQLLPLTMPDVPVVVSDRLEGYTEFEPEVAGLLQIYAPRALESALYTALLEGAASFHTCQQRAMAAATDNADDLSQTLSRNINRARQDSITTEIMEIVGGAEALRSRK